MREPTSTLHFFSSGPGPEMIWSPLTDIYRTHEGWLVKMDLAGVRLQDISITRQGVQLCISGARHDLVVKDCCHHYAMEIPYNRFERTIQMPCSVERASLTVECCEGLLLLRVRMEEEINRADNVDYE